MTIVLTILCAMCLCACQPSVPAPHLLARQRVALDQAKMVEGMVQRQADERMKALDDTR